MNELTISKINQTASLLTGLKLTLDQTKEIIMNLADIIYSDGYLDGLKKGEEICLNQIHDTFKKAKK